MNNARRTQSAQPAKTLRLFTPEGPEMAVGAQDWESCAPTRDPFQGPESADLVALLMAENPEERFEIPESDRPRARMQTLWLFWNEWLRPRREAAVLNGQLKPATLDKERQVLNRFNDWEQSQEPAWWKTKASGPWQGAFLAALTAPYLGKFFKHELLRCAPETVQPRWYQMRTILNAAVNLRVLEKAPAVDFSTLIATPKGGRLSPVDLVATQYTEAQLSQIFRLLNGVEHQTAWVLGANAGPRSEDLYGLCWEINVRLDDPVPYVIYVAQKTGKTHWIPLAPVTVKHLERLKAGRLFAEGPLFPSLSGHHCKTPGKSQAARDRTAHVKKCLEAAGIPVTGDFEKPIQVLRSTCNSRMKNHRPAVGELLTHGPDYSDVNIKSYDDFRPRIIEAVMTLPQPDAFIL